MGTLPEDQFLNTLGLFGLDRTKAQEALNEVKSITTLQKGTANDLKVLLGGREVSEKDILPRLAGKGLDRTKTLEAFLDMRSLRISAMQQNTAQKINTVLPPVVPPPVAPMPTLVESQEKEYEDSDAGEFERIADRVDDGVIKGMDAVQDGAQKALQLIGDHPKKAMVASAGIGVLGGAGLYAGVVSSSLLPQVAVGAGIAGAGLYLRKKLQESGYKKFGNFVGGVSVGAGVLTGAGLTTVGAPLGIALAGGYGLWKGFRYGIPAVLRFFQKRQDRWEAKQNPPSP